MRGIKFGSITRYVSTTDELVGFLRTRPNLPCSMHLTPVKRKISVIKSGDNPIHYAYYYLYTTWGLKAVLAITVFRLFVPDLITKHISPDIWASNIPALPKFYCVGRFGMFFKAARKNCLAEHYLLFADHIKTRFLSNENQLLKSWELDRALNGARSSLNKYFLGRDAGDTCGEQSLNCLPLAVTSNSRRLLS